MDKIKVGKVFLGSMVSIKSEKIYRKNEKFAEKKNSSNKKNRLNKITEIRF